MKGRTFFLFFLLCLFFFFSSSSCFSFSSPSSSSLPSSVFSSSFSLFTSCYSSSVSSSSYSSSSSLSFSFFPSSGCASAKPCLQESRAQEKPAVLYDDLGHPFRVGEPPRRIVSLAPNITEILFALGRGERVVGVTRFCNFPPEAEAKEKVGGMIDPSPEKIESLRPDLIFAFRGNPIGLLRKLDSLGFPVFVLETGTTLETLEGTIEKIGRAAGAENEAAELVESLRRETRLVLDALKDLASRPRVFLALHGEGFWTCGRESYLHDLIEKAGGENIAGRMERRWLNLNVEQLIRADPEVIVILARNEQAFVRARERFLGDRRLKDVAAVRAHRVHLLDEDSASRFGPRLVDALRRLAEILHPERFGAVG